MKKKIIAFLVPVLFVAACRKKENLPADIKDEPVFYVKGKLGIQKLTVEAGNEGFYMHSSYSQVQDRLYVYRADLSNSCGTACGYTVSVLINDYHYTSPGGAMEPDKALRVGEYQLFDETLLPKSQIVKLVPVSAQRQASYSWTIDDGSAKQTISSYSTEPSLEIGKTYTVTFSSEDFDGTCASTFSQVFKVGNPFQVQINCTSDSSSTFLFTAKNDLSGTYTYNWDFGDGKTASGENTSHVYANDGKYLVKLTSTNSKGETCVTSYQAVVMPNVCEANFNATFVPPDAAELLRNITFLITTGEGKTYSSAEAVQSVTAKVRVTNVEPYKINEKGEPTMKLSLAFECKLKDGSTELSLTEGEAVIAVSFKN